MKEVYKRNNRFYFFCATNGLHLYTFFPGSAEGEERLKVASE